jgi:ornithine cyclodeaminase
MIVASPVSLPAATRDRVAEAAASPAATLAVVNGAAVRALVPMADAIDIVTKAMIALSAGQVDAPERWAMPVAPEGLMGLMPGTAPLLQCFGVKALSIYAHPGEDRPGHQGVMLLFDRTDGQPVCVIESGVMTALRTAAASALATRTLAPPGTRSVALLGCGIQADWHVEAMRAVRPVEEFRVWSRSAGRAAAFAKRHRAPGEHWVVAGTPRAAVEGADIVCTLTRASEPVLFGEWLSPGQHVNLVGASRRNAREADDALVARSRYVTDSTSHALTQAGELCHAIEAGIVDRDHVVGELGDVLRGAIGGRLAASDITVFKSLGHAAQDLFMADAISGRLGASSAVQRVDW